MGIMKLKFGTIIKVATEVAYQRPTLYQSENPGVGV